ncbi:class II aaRS and biotin synthetase [Durotheca rogersii]|uniref:class II aaRS and biotin synthetase n=1 Tax=Durotheca rogersii TaxID=419775 RepID=UPI0022210A9F|nr:class II aaRS and biotin synthetase [Durotheca rogersii]KAI5861446.1 class II aaRS and biotin synthetase [Durotheca rogersii]
MPPRKLNVLVYTGAGSTVESVKHAIYTLRRLLSPNYAVIPITETTLLKEPWGPSCALLVFPGGADLGYCRVLDGNGNSIISQYVRRGGAYLGFCAGGYYGTKRCEFEVGNPAMEVAGPRELGFFPGTCRGGAWKGFQYHSESGARAVRLDVTKAAFSGAGVVPEIFTSYYNGGGVFVGSAIGTSDVDVLASYADELDVDGGPEKAAIVYCKVGQGAAILTGPHPEFTAVNLSPHNDVPGYDKLIATLRASDDARSSFLKACLAKLGLEINQETSHVPSLSQLHLSSITSSHVDELLHSFQDIISREDGEEYIRAENDTFHLQGPETPWSVSDMKEALTSGNSPNQTPPDGKGEGIIDYNAVIKHVVAHNKDWPEAKATPYFNHSTYYSSLREYRETEPEAEDWGDFLMYGEVVTSTNTVLEKNTKLLSRLPSGFTFVATTQVAGRGRGNNVWVSPAGCLIMSTVINHPAHLAQSRPIVFLQYLAALAVVKAVQAYGDGYAGIPVKIKWPNDIYALDPRPASPSDAPAAASSSPSYVKIGGILANCSYIAGAYQVVLGIGVNTTNGRPTTSLDALLLAAASSASASAKSLAPFRVERLAAAVVARLEGLYATFARRGFTPDMERAYYAHWLHGGQVVRLEGVDDAGAGGRSAEGRARIVGITRDWGLLRAEELDDRDRPTGRVWALQSDENSFDFFRGLVRRRI